MRWTERQRAMLREMGIRIWAPEGVVEVERAIEAEVAFDRRQRAAVEVIESDEVIEAIGPVGPTAAASAPRLSPSNFAASSRLQRADWLVVGEPFGSAADVPVVADAQRLLANMLGAIGVAQDAPEPDARACYLPLADAPDAGLFQAFDVVQPRCVIALGRAAAQALLNLDEPLGRLRERVHEHAGIPVMVTFSLAYLLRHPADKAKAWADLCRAVTAAGSSPRPPASG